MAQQARDWGGLPARYAAVVLTDGSANANVIPELGGRVAALGRTNVLRVPDPGEWAYPNAGGIYVSLSDSYLTAPRAIAWQLASATREAATLTGKSDSGQALYMQIGMAQNRNSEATLRMRVTVSNPADAPARVAIFCRAEFNCGSSREAALSYRDRSGTERKQEIRLGDRTADGSALLTGGELPQQQWELACANPALRVGNRFEADQVARCGFSWSFRGAAGLNISLSVASPEVELAPGQELSLTSEYYLGTFRGLA